MRSIAVVDCSSAFENGTVENPLPPCGACSEWLGKIAEASDNFRVLTFTDHLFDIVIERCLQNTIEESLDIPAEMTAWTCSWCETWNEPRTQFCKKCESHRNRDSNMIPALQWSRRYHRIIQLLTNKEEGMTINEISEARHWPINFLTLWIDHLVKAGALKKDGNDRYRAVPEALKKMSRPQDKTNTKTNAKKEGALSNQQQASGSGQQNQRQDSGSGSSKASDDQKHGGKSFHSSDSKKSLADDVGLAATTPALPSHRNSKHSCAKFHHNSKRPFR